MAFFGQKALKDMTWSELMAERVKRTLELQTAQEALLRVIEEQAERSKRGEDR